LIRESAVPMLQNEPDPLFLAVLIYDDGNGRYSEESRQYQVAHPEIAYQLAVAAGSVGRYGRRFLGLANLIESDEEIEPITRSTGGNGTDFVTPKEYLEAFRDPRWQGVPCDETDLAKALRPPTLLFELEGLGSIPWDRYSHAYGPAVDVPMDLSRLAAEDPEIRESARWQLGGSIYHQGTIYSATAVAIPFLAAFSLETRLPDRAKIAGLLAEIANSACLHPEIIRRAWRERAKFGNCWRKPPTDMAEEEIANCASVRQAIVRELDRIHSLSADSDAETAEYGRKIIERIETPQSNCPPCTSCKNTGKCFCRRKGKPVDECKRCNGTGVCHVCAGVGDDIR
jgi:hypothetical protein